MIASTQISRVVARDKGISVNRTDGLKIDNFWLLLFVEVLYIFLICQSYLGNQLLEKANAKIFAFMYRYGKMDIASILNQDMMTALYMIELPSCLLEGSHMLITAGPRKLLHIFAL